MYSPIPREHKYITYIVYTDGMTYEDNPCSDKVIKQLYDCVFEDGSVRIYKTF